MRYQKPVQQVFETVEFGLGGVVSNSFVLYAGEENGYKRLWVSKVLFLSRISTWDGRETEKLAFL